jgi:hypothetical protein
MLNVGEIETCSQFYQRFTSSLCADIISPKQLQSQALTKEKLRKTLSYEKFIC